MPNNKGKCQAGTIICSGELIQSYAVNGSDKDGKTFRICGPCAVYLRRTNRLKPCEPINARRAKR